MENKKEIKLNVSYLEFIKKIKEEKISLENKEEIVKVYGEIVKLRFSNNERVFKRVLREENKEKLERELKRMSISKKEFLEMGEKVKEMSKESKLSNYL